MSSMDERQNSTSSHVEQIVGRDSIPPAYFTKQASTTEQLPFPTYAPSQTPGFTRPLTEVSPVSTPGTTTGLIDYTPFPPNTTRQLTETLQAGTYAKSTNTTALRQPVVIRATGKKSSGTIRPPKGGRRIGVHIAVTMLLVCIVFGTLLAVVPAGSNEKGGFNPFRSISDFVSNKSNATGLIAQQAATATAVTQDGYDPGGNHTYAGLPTAPPGFGGLASGNLSRFAYGQCTYWANMRYHQLTGYWVDWLGNAYQWRYGAAAAGWLVSAKPVLHSIIVLPPYAEGASGFGHVAIVEQINSDGSVVTSNYNWGGNWNRMTYVTFYPAAGVVFVWHP